MGIGSTVLLRCLEVKLKKISENVSERRICPDFNKGLFQLDAEESSAESSTADAVFDSDCSVGINSWTSAATSRLDESADDEETWGVKTVIESSCYQELVWMISDDVDEVIKGEAENFPRSSYASP